MNQKQQLTVKNNEYLFSHFPIRKKDSNISKVLVMLEKEIAMPICLSGHKTLVLINKWTHVFFSSIKKRSSILLWLCKDFANFSSLDPCYSSTKIMTVTNMLNTLPPEHIEHLSPQLFTHFFLLLDHLFSFTQSLTHTLNLTSNPLFIAT